MNSKQQFKSAAEIRESRSGAQKKFTNSSIKLTRNDHIEANKKLLQEQKAFAASTSRDAWKDLKSFFVRGGNLVKINTATVIETPAFQQHKEQKTLEKLENKSKSQIFDPITKTWLKQQ